MSLQRICKFLVILALAGLLGFLWFYSYAEAIAGPSVPLGLHCRGVSPIEDWCGCTWGAVFYHGRPITNAQVTINYGTGIVQGSTLFDTQECYPYYGLDGAGIGLSRLDVFTVTATYKGQSVSRTVRAVPDNSGEQQVNLILDDVDGSLWTHYSENDLVRSVVLQNDTLWSGGDAGVTRYQQPYGCSVSFDETDLPTQEIQSLVSTADSLWAGTPNGVSAYNDTSWTLHDPGLASSNIAALAVHPTTHAIYVGANAYSDGGVSCYDGSWHPLPDVNGSRPNTVQALMVDNTGQLWVGTESGLSHCTDTSGISCVTYRTDQGLGSNNVIDIAEAPNGDVWVATWSYITEQGTRGGVSQYDRDQNSWIWYTPEEGIAAWDVATVAVDELGRVWLGTWGGGVSRFDGYTWTTFTTTHGLPSNYVRDLTIDDEGTIWAGTDVGLYRFPDNALASLTTAFIESVIPSQATQGRDILTFSGAVNSENEVLGYEWRSDLDGVLSASRTFDLEATVLSVGIHQVQFRVQNKDGSWSEADTTPIVIREGWFIYLPLMLKA